MSRWRVEIPRHRFRVLAWVGLLVVVPKCLLCIAAYASAGVALEIGGRELCGAATGPVESWVQWLLLPGIVLVLIGSVASRTYRPRPSAQK